MTGSLSLMVPAQMGYDANRIFAALGRGPRNFSVLCYAAGGLMIGLHTWEGDAERYTAPPVPSGGWEAHGLTAARVAEIAGAMVFSAQPPGTMPPDNFAALAGSQGVTWGAMLPELPEAGSNVEVVKDKFYQTSQPGFEVVRIVQTHRRDNHTYTDLSVLLNLYEPQRDPFNPAPWRQPVGDVGLYQTTNLIGGPELATHDGKTWRNTAANNAFAPGVYGWVEYPEPT